MEVTDQLIYPIAVIGSGAAGTMATLRAVLNNDLCLLFTGSARDKKKSRASWIRKIDNIPGYHHFKKGVTEPYQQTIQWINESDLKDKLKVFSNIGITKILKSSNNIFELHDSQNQVHYAKYVVLATGMMDIQPKIAGDITPILPYANMQTVNYCLRCDGHFSLNKKTTVIGYNDSAAWVACMLHERYQPPKISILLNNQDLKFSDEVQLLLKKYKINIFQHEIVEVIGDTRKGIHTAFKLSDGSIVESEQSFVSLGIIAYNDLALMLGAEVDERGLVITNSFGESSVENLYVAGDLRANTKKQIYTAWDNAVDALDNINLKIRRSKR